MLVFVPFLPTDETLVEFHDALEFLGSFGSGTCFAQPVQDEPRGLLRDADFFRELHGTDSLAGCDKQVHRVEPLVQRDFAALKDGSRSHGEIEVAASVTAVETSALAGSDAVPALAVRTADAIGPEARLQIESRCVLIGEGLEELEGADSRSAHLVAPRIVYAAPE